MLQNIRSKFSSVKENITQDEEKLLAIVLLSSLVTFLAYGICMACHSSPEFSALLLPFYFFKEICNLHYGLVLSSLKLIISGLSWIATFGESEIDLPDSDLSLL